MKLNYISNYFVIDYYIFYCNKKYDGKDFSDNIIFSMSNVWGCGY